MSAAVASATSTPSGAASAAGAPWNVHQNPVCAQPAAVSRSISASAPGPGATSVHPRSPGRGRTPSRSSTWLSSPGSSPCTVFTKSRSGSVSHASATAPPIRSTVTPAGLPGRSRSVSTHATMNAEAARRIRRTCGGSVIAPPQAARPGAAEARIPDRGLGGADVVVGPKPRRRALGRVEDDVARPGVAVARLADGSGVHDERPLAVRERRARRHGAADELAVLVAPEELHVAVADQAQRPALPLEAEGRRPRVDDVLPDRVADAAVEHLHALALAAGHARAERRDLILAEDGARPLGGVAGVVGEHVDVDDARPRRGRGSRPGRRPLARRRSPCTARGRRRSRRRRRGTRSRRPAPRRSPRARPPGPGRFRARPR